jgi:hypothetical protein
MIITVSSIFVFICLYLFTGKTCKSFSNALAFDRCIQNDDPDAEERVRFVFVLDEIYEN